MRTERVLVEVEKKSKATDLGITVERRKAGNTFNEGLILGVFLKY